LHHRIAAMRDRATPLLTIARLMEMTVEEVESLL
jgi:hypothetical protein